MWRGRRGLLNSPMQNLTSLTATQLAAAIREGRVSSVEVVEAHLAQIAARNPALNAIVTLDEEGALARAREADSALARGEVWGPLHGVPMTLKDGHSTAGMRTTAGYAPLAGHVPGEDGTVAARLKGAGAIVMGKTNVSELLSDIQASNPIFGRTNNPYDPSRTSGGSSGGAAAALASHMTPLEIGSDFAGSIRIPAHFCGVYALKPTEHRVSMFGHIPDLPGSVRSHRFMWSIGPLARSLEDLELAYRIVAGPDGRDPDVPPVPIGDVPHLEPRDLRIAWASTFPGVPAAASIRDALHGLAAELDRAGAVVEERLPDIDFGDMARARVALANAVQTTFMPGEEAGPPATMSDFFAALHRRDGFLMAWERFFGGWDALLCPVSMTTTFTHRTTGTPIEVDGTPANYWRTIGHCAPFNFTGHPCVVLPLGRDADGLPIGAQLVGRRWGEGRLLAVAAAVDRVIGH